MVSILSGPDAGQWRRIAQAIGPTTYLLDDAPARRATTPSRSRPGFVGETFRENTIDSRGGSVAANLVLVGNQFGLKVIDNHLLGGGEAFRITAAPTEKPVHWGWSHAPLLGATIEGNTDRGFAAGRDDQRRAFAEDQDEPGPGLWLGAL